jgi:hypothetical protein
LHQGLSIWSKASPLPFGQSLAQLAKGRANALFGLTCLTFLATLCFFESLDRCEKPSGFRFAIDHGENSFLWPSAAERQAPPAASWDCPAEAFS